MSQKYCREILRRNVAQICQKVGWKSINSIPLDILTQVLEDYIIKLGKQTNHYAELFNRTEPNLNDLGLVFRALHIKLPELLEHTQYRIPPPVRTEKFPKHKESNLNFLSPASLEATTRPIHVYKHLPPMYPEKEPVNSSTFVSNKAYAGSLTEEKIFKRPLDPVSLPKTKRPKLEPDKQMKTPEINSEKMTSLGVLSPVREGKLPVAYIPESILYNDHEEDEDKSHQANASILNNDHEEDEDKSHQANASILNNDHEEDEDKSQEANASILNNDHEEDEDKSHQANASILNNDHEEDEDKSHEANASILNNDHEEDEDKSHQPNAPIVLILEKVGKKWRIKMKDERMKRNTLLHDKDKKKNKKDTHIGQSSKSKEGTVPRHASNDNESRRPPNQRRP